MKLTKSKLKQIIREEIKKLNEGGIGKFGRDESDVFGGIVMQNKNKKPKDILKIVLKDKFLTKNIKSKGISNKELLNYIDGELRFAR
jgi:Mg2+/Co2+ transporter CorC